MELVGTVESLWRYPVKSMRGEELSEAFLGFSGVTGDRRYGFGYSRARKEFPYLTAREQPAMLRYKATYQPATQEGVPVWVETPAGERHAVDDPTLVTLLAQGVREGEFVTFLASDRAMTDCHPISLFSVQTARRIGEELGLEVDKRRFRANVYIDLASEDGFGEDQFVGRKLQIGSQAVVEIIERDPRCKMITLDPDTTQANPNVMRQVARAHDGKAGVYGSVLVEGIVKTGDKIVVLP